MERQEGTSVIEFDARFSSAQFHPSPTTVLKGVLNRRVVKESHRDAGRIKAFRPSYPFFFFSHQRLAHRSIPFERFPRPAHCVFPVARIIRL